MPRDHFYESVVEALLEQPVAQQSGTARPQAGTARPQAGQPRAGQQAQQGTGAVQQTGGTQNKPLPVQDIGAIVIRFNNGQEMEISKKTDPQAYEKWKRLLAQNASRL